MVGGRWTNDVLTRSSNLIAAIWKHLVNATLYSLAGLRAAFRRELAFRLETCVLVIVVPTGLWLGRSGVERALLIGSWCLVMVIELLNSAIEVLVDRKGTEHNELAGRAKDLGSAAVLAAVGLAVTVWVLVLMTG
jgi:diacylglycerol kinase (ATP)